MVLRAPLKKPGEFELVDSADRTGGLTAAQWRDKVSAARSETDLSAKKTLFTELFKDLAQTAKAHDLLVSVNSDYPINIAFGDGSQHAEGLNLVVGSGAQEGVTGYVNASGQFGVPLDISQPADQQRVAIRLYGSSFSDDKLTSLVTLRHEMVHAHYHEYALRTLRAWQQHGSKGTFDAWVSKQKDLTDVDRRLIKDDEGVHLDKDRLGYPTDNTELLAYLEGFMTGFVLTDPKATSPKLWLQLLGALSGSGAYGWANASPEVKSEAKLRLHRFYCDVIDDKHRKAFDDWVDEESKQVKEDQLASDGQATSGRLRAHADEQEKLEDFVSFLLSLRGCKMRAR